MSVPQKIAVNTRFLIKGKLEGIGLFTYESLKKIVHNHPETEFFFLFDRPYDKSFVFGPNVTPVVLHPQARRPFLWYWWFEFSVARWLKKNKPQLFLSTDGYACLKTDVPQVLVMHDLAFEHFKDHVPFFVSRYYKRYMPRFAHKASRIATVSEFSKNDIIKQYGIDANIIDVVYNGAKEVYRPVDETTRQLVKQRISKGADYFIYVGSVHPRKNIGRLLQAFDQFKTITSSNIKLVIVGRMAWNFGDVQTIFERMNFNNEVIFLGHVPAEELGEITASALAMVYVSLFEGFGIPIVEAMSAGVPVITSNTTSMPEAAGDAALLVNPENTNDIASAMQQIAQQAELRGQLVTKGFEQVKKFSWDTTAQKLWDSCVKAMDN